MAEPITLAQLIDAREDATTLSLFVNADATTQVPRRLAPAVETLEYWRNYMSALAKGRDGVDGISASIDSLTVTTGAAGTAASVVTGGTSLDRTFALTIPRGDKGDKGVDGSYTLKAYATYVAMTDAAALPVGDPLKIPANTSVNVTNDTDTTKNGMYTYNGTVFTKSAYDPLALAKDDATFKANEAIATASDDATFKANEAIATASDDATFKANEALNRAKMYATNNDSIVVANLKNEESKNKLNSFFGDYKNGVLIDASQHTDVQVMTVTDGIKTYQSIDEYMPNAFKYPKVVMDKNGAWGFAPHNLLNRTDNIAAWAKLGLTAENVNSVLTNTNTATLLKSTATLANINLGALGLANSRHVTYNILVKPLVKTTHAYLRLHGNNYVIFDLVDKVVSTMGIALSATVVVMDEGYYKISATYLGHVSYNEVAVGMSDNASAVASSIGLTMLVEQPQMVIGGKELAYTISSGLGARVLPAIDYYKNPEGSLLIEGNRGYDVAQTEDFTQSVWVKTNMTASLTAVSPINTPCSTLSATADNATVIQTSTQTLKWVSVFIKRKQGTGAILVTADNVTWKDVTNEVNSQKYTRVLVGGTGTNCGIKLAQLGDAVDVSMFNGSRSTGLISPFLFNTVGFSLTGDVMPEIPLSGEVTVYTDGNYLYTKESNTAYAFSRLSGSDGSSFTGYFSEALAHSGIAYKSVSSATTKIVNSSSSKQWDRLEVTALASKLKNRVEVSNNGENTRYIMRAGVPTVDKFTLQAPNGGTIYINKMMLVKEAIDVYDIKNWRYSGEQYNTGLVDVLTMGKDSEIVGSEKMRGGSIFILNDDGEDVDILAIAYNIKLDGFHPEAPARMMQRRIRFNKSTRKLKHTSPLEVMYQQAQWEQGKGHVGDAALVRIKSGANRGRILNVFSQAETETLDVRNLFCMYSDDEAKVGSWSTPVKILDAQTAFGISTTVGTCDGSIMILPLTHKAHPSRIITLGYYTGSFCVVYSDDGGVTWGHKAQVRAVSGEAIAEPTLASMPNGDLLVSMRSDTGVGSRINFLSVDGGDTWTEVGKMINFVGANVGSSLTQIDQSGVTGAKGNIILVGSGNTKTAGRAGLGINYIADDLITVEDRFFPINEYNSVGYTSAKSILNGEYIAVGFESGTSLTSFNGDANSYLAIVKV